METVWNEIEENTIVVAYAICKNEEQFVERWMESVGTADRVIVLDTGSTDDTIGKLRHLGATVEQKIVEPWRFDVARNHAIDLVRQECSECILFSIDLDETIEQPDWCDRVKLACSDGVNRANYNYVWSHLPDGSNGCLYSYDKIHSLDYEWYLPCHELLRRRQGAYGEEKWADVDVTVHHYPDSAKSRGNYINLLKLAVEEFPDNDRMAHYYGRELFFYGRYQDALTQLSRHINLQSATWLDERCQSMIYIAKCFNGLGYRDAAEQWFLRSCAEAPYLREPWFETAQWYTSQNKFPQGYAFAKRCLQVEKRQSTYATTSQAWNEGPDDVIGTCAYYLGLTAESLNCSRRASEKAPWDKRLKENVVTVERMSENITKRHFPNITQREKWSINPKFGLVISTYGSYSYVDLHLRAATKRCSPCPILVVDDCSDQTLDILCKFYHADFHKNKINLNHTRGDLQSICTGLKWAKSNNIDVLVKMSRRFIPKVDWRPSLKQLIFDTQLDTFAGNFDATWGLRSECIAFHVDKWLEKVPELEKIIEKSDWLWVEKVLHDTAISVNPIGTGIIDGFAVWDYVGLGKWCKDDTHLWHDTTSPQGYADYAQELGLTYTADNFIM